MTGWRVGLLAAATCIAALAAAELWHLRAIRSPEADLPICRVDTQRKVVALSFDDGPDPVYTPAILRLLTSASDRATFFVVGSQAERQSLLVRSELVAGMQVGDHTWSHPHLPSVDLASMRTEMDRTRTLLAGLGAGVSLFRAPYGEITPDQLAAVRAAGLTSVQWSIPLDHYVGGLGLAPREAAAALVGDLQPGDIILAHDAHLLPQDGGAARTAAMATLQLLIPALKAKGFEVTTVSDLLGTGTPVKAEPRPWFWQTGFNCPR